MKYLPRRDYRCRPRKNGGGITHEVAIWPEGAGMDDFIWRVSLAELHQPGRFSNYPGVNRSLMLLEGHPVRLEMDGRLIWLGNQVLNFFGTAQITAYPDGRALDVGVMSRVGSCQHRCQAVHLEGSSQLTRGAQAALLMLVDGGPVRITVNADAVELDRFDSLWWEPQDDGTLQAETMCPACVLLAEFDCSEGAVVLTQPNLHRSSC